MAEDGAASSSQSHPWLPEWSQGYRRATLASDLLAAVIVTVLLIPQSLAYALLAGLPPETGLYASLLPLVCYALFGSSRTLAVGPVAVISLMTAAAVGPVAAETGIGRVEAAIALAAISGFMLLAMGLLRLGFLANFLSHPVVSGFITASGLLIALSQLKHILGVSASGHNLPQLAGSLWLSLGAINLPSVAIGLLSLALLWWSRTGLGPLLVRAGVGREAAAMMGRTGPVWAVVVCTALVMVFELDSHGVGTLGEIPAGLPALQLPRVDLAVWQPLLLSAALISVVGFVESVSVGQTLAARKRQRISPNRELLGLGAANIGAAVSGAFPVTGGFSRSVVNFDAGAQTPAAGIFTAVGIGMAALFLTDLLRLLPIATLAATIIVAVASLIDLKTLRETLRYSHSDFAAMMTTIALTLLVGVETGISAGVILSLLLYLYRTSRPHTAIVGQIRGTEHFRNRDRHEVLLSETMLTIRVDASLYFANARFLEDCVMKAVAERPRVTDVVLMCPSVSHIDSSALHSLETINHRLQTAGVKLHLSEVKGPVMDRLERSRFLQELTGAVFLSQYQAAVALAPADTDILPEHR
jgi:SulP family sulfate permease